MKVVSTTTAAGNNTEIIDTLRLIHKTKLPATENKAIETKKGQNEV